MTIHWNLVIGLPTILACNFARAEYHNFNTANTSDGIIEEVRWPYWAETTYNAIYSQTLSGSDGGSCYFYGGMPSDPSGQPPCSIIWSFWPPSGTVIPGAAVTAYWSATNMYAPPHVGEGASGKVAGPWSLIQSNEWYREVFRIWQPPDGTPHVAYVGRWLRDSVSGNWYHIATMKIPFSATGLNGLSGFQEDFGNGNRNPRRTDFRNVYYHQNGAWSMANQFTPSVRQLGENGTCGLIENSTAAFFETCSGSNYLFNVSSNPPAVTGNLVMLIATNWASTAFLTNPPAGVTTVAASGNYAQYTLTMSNQPAAPALDAFVASNVSAQVSGSQLLVTWQVSSFSAPQLAYQIEIFNNSGYTGTAAVVFFDRDPEARQKLMNIAGVNAPSVRLSLVDIFDRTNTPVLIAPATATLNAATNVVGTVNGLNYAYCESTTSYYWESDGVNWSAIPNFGALTPIYQGAVDNPDLTLHRRRNGYAFNYTGFFSAPADGLYAFTLNSSDGAKLFVDGALVVNWDGVHSPGPLSGWAGLQAGKHAVTVQYFFNTQNSNAGDLIDTLSVSYEGPDMAPAKVPDSAWSRLPAGNEPAITLNSPANGNTLCGSNITFAASVTANGAAVNNVQFYLGNNFWGQDATAPYTSASFVWAAPNNPVRARLFYNSGNTVDSPQSLFTTTNMSLAPWLLAVIGDHVYPVGGKLAGGVYSILGDGLNLMSRQVSGDCTITAHLAGIIGTGATPDGQTPGSGWEAGIILRGTTNSTPGTPLGNSNSRYAAVFATVSSDTHFQDDTMSNGGGPYWSSGLGGQRWFRIQRVSDTFTTSVSTDGVTWTGVNTNTLTGIGTTIFVGMFTYAASSQNPNVFWASFDNLSITGNLVGPPSASIAPQNRNAFAGQNAAFSAMANGNPPFAYQWQSNGVTIPGATNTSITLTNVQPFSSGVYGVVVSNWNGTAAASATLSVLTPPPAAAQLLSNNPVAYWRLNEAVGPVAYDSAGSYNGTGEGNILFGQPGVGSSSFAGFEPGHLGVQFNGVDSDVAVPALNLNTNALTITAWVKRSGTQAAWSGLVFCRAGSTTAGLHFGTANELRYTWNNSGSTYNWNSGLTVPDGVWTFVGLVIQPSQAVMYLATNSTLRSAVNVVANPVQAFAGTTDLGYDPNQSSRRFNGTLDEVAVYNQSLSAAQINAILSASLTAAPSVGLTAPTSGAVFAAPATIGLLAAVTTNGHTISQVQFFNGGTLLGQATTPPYSLTWSNVSTGIYTVLGKLIYDAGAAVFSPPVFVNVLALPTTPASITPVALANNLINVSWPAAANATGYLLNRNGLLIATTAATNYLDFGLTPGTTYCYSVAALNSIGNSSNSPTNCAATQVSGAALWWNPSGSTTGPQDGNGNWGNNGAVWWNGTANGPWANGSLVFFGSGTSTNCTVAITNDVTPSGVNFVLNNGGSYTLAAAGGGLNLSGAPVFEFDADATISAVLKGNGGLNKTGGGTLTLGAVNTFTGGFSVNGGLVRLNAGSYNQVISSSALTTINSGGTVQTIDVNSVYGNDFVVNAGGTLTFSAYHAHPRTITMAGGLLNGTGSGKYNNDDFQLDGSVFTVNGSSPSTVALPNGMSLRYTPTINVADVTGDAAPDLAILGPGSIHNYDTGASAFTKGGLGTMLLANSNTYTGPTTVSAGTLMVNGSIGASTVTVQNTATLAGLGVIGGPTTVQAGGTIAPGSNGIGAFTFSKTLTLAGNTIMELSKSASGTTNDLIAVGSTLTLGGFLVVTNMGAGALAIGDSFKLFNAVAYAGSFTTLSLPPLSPGLAWDTSKLTNNGTLAVIAGTLPPKVPPVFTNITTLSDGNIALGGTGAVGQVCILLGASNLLPPISWAPLATNTAGTNSAFVFTDLHATNYSQRYYRTLSP